MGTERTLLVGGLGRPHDTLVAAGLRAQGRRVATLGALDRDALEQGRAALPRGQCAPLLYTTGALLRAVDAMGDRPLAQLGLQSCGPCRYALFEDAWRRAVRDAHPRADVGFLRLTQSTAGLTERLGFRTVVHLVETVVVADALAEQVRRLAPRVDDLDALDAACDRTVRAIADAIGAGARPLAALEAQARWHAHIPRRDPGSLARAVIIGEPWSLHVDGDGQLNLPRVLAQAGVAADVPPLSLWIAYLLWQERAVAWGGRRPDASTVHTAGALERALSDAATEAARVAGLDGFGPPDVDALAELAAPHLPPGLLGGYGHVEVGLAVRARVERRAHLVISVKSFGCIPSSGIADGIVPTVLGDVPFLALEVCADGEAARESRLMMRIAAARERAEREGAGAARREVRA